ncbi:MAG: transporter substrate-binding domain-containing protein [Bacteroidales bacterium]|nr:transporter substrate-binding domain-containing protein [Bacteroidales bacterium]
MIAIIMTVISSCTNAPEQPATVAGYASLEDLDGHTVAVVSGSTSDVLLSDTNNFPKISLIRFNSPTELVEAVMNDSADCGITDTVVLMTLEMEQHGLAIDFNLPGGFDVAVAFNPKDKELCGQFNDFLVQIKSDGTLDEMCARWCSKQVDTVQMLDMPELAELKGHPIEVATLADNPPFSFYRNNRWTGLEVEMMHRFSLFVGRPVHFSGYNFDEIVDVILSRKAEAAAANLFITPDRADKVLFSHPYYLCKTSCFSKAR